MEERTRSRSSPDEDDPKNSNLNAGSGSSDLDLLRARKQKVGSSRWFGDDITVEILTRLPAASLARFRCVCKQWNKLACDCHVLLQHAERIGRASPPPRISSLHMVKNSAVLTVRNQEFSSMYSLRLTHDTMAPPPSGLRMSNSCLGLICIYGEYSLGDIILLNPTTGEYARLPELEPEIFGENRLVFQRCYLGFLPATKECKVLRICKALSFCCAPKKCQIITLESTGISSSWRKTSDAGCLWSDHTSLTDAVVADGKIHWLSRCIASPAAIAISSFDLKHETFRRITPTYDELKPIDRDSLVWLNGSLCWAIPDYYGGERTVSVLVLEEDEEAKEQRFTKLFTIYEHDGGRFIVGHREPFVTGYKGILLVRDQRGYLRCYDLWSKIMIRKPVSHLAEYSLPKNLVSEIDEKVDTLVTGIHEHVGTLVSRIGGQSIRWSTLSCNKF